MLWFEPFPLGRWALVILVALVAAYVEFRPDPTVDQAFAIVAIEPGDTLDETNTEMRPVPSGLIETAEQGAVASRPVDAGDPVLASDVVEASSTIPHGWWVVGVELPQGARSGDRVRLVVLDDGSEVEGVVAHAGSEDPFDAADGGVAVPSDSASIVAKAASDGRLAVLISTG